MKKLTTFLFLLVALLAMNCKVEFENSKILDFGSFQLEVPAHWHKFPLMGYDSQVGGITNGRDTLTYDFGWYSYDFSNETTETHARTETTIDGHDALIVRPKKKGKGLIGVFVRVDNLNKFNLYGKSKNESTVFRIFESIKFK